MKPRWDAIVGSGSWIMRTEFRVLVLLVLLLLVGCRTRTAALPEPRHIYVADWANHRIVRFDDMDGSNWVEWTGPEGTPLQFPVSVHGNGSGLLTIGEQRHQRVIQSEGLFGGNGRIVPTRDPSPRRVNKYLGSWVCSDSQGRLYLTGDGKHRLVRLDAEGPGWTAFGEEGSGIGQFRYPAGVCLDAQGRIYVADFDNFRVVRFDDLEGANWVSYGSFGPGVGQFINPCGLAIDGQGRLYIADQGNDRVVRIDDMTGTNWISVGSFGTLPERGRLYAPTGLCVDAAGRIYVTEASSNHRVVRMDDMHGAGWRVFGHGGTGRGEFASPMGIWVE